MSSTPTDPATLQEGVLTWDPNTAINGVVLSDENRTVKGKMGAPACPHPSIKAFDWPMVKSKEPIGSFWVFEWSGPNVVVGVASAYSPSDQIRESSTAWSLDCYDDYYDACHAGSAIRLPIPPSSTKQIRVDFDPKRHTVSFSQITPGPTPQSTELHKFTLPNSEEPLFAVALVWPSCSATLLP
ncbi:unnamed protein product [Boreogadus saida]